MLPSMLVKRISKASEFMIMHISRFKRKVILSSFMAQTGVCYVQKLPEFRTFSCMQPAYQIRNLNLLLYCVINTKWVRKNLPNAVSYHDLAHMHKRFSISITNSSQCPSKLSQITPPLQIRPDKGAHSVPWMSMVSSAGTIAIQECHNLEWINQHFSPFPIF